VERCESG